MGYLIIFHPVADKEYSKAYQWYEERLEGLGDRFAEAIVESDYFKAASFPKEKRCFP